MLTKEVTECTCEVSFGEKGPKVIGDIILHERTLQLQQSVSTRKVLKKSAEYLARAISSFCMLLQAQTSES
jgi:hypothetical protein